MRAYSIWLKYIDELRRFTISDNDSHSRLLLVPINTFLSAFETAAIAGTWILLGEKELALGHLCLPLALVLTAGWIFWQFEVTCLP
jgi:hypothetical protein